VKTSCPPSNSGSGKELSTAKFIEISAANNNIPVPPCCDSWAPISTILTGPLIVELLKRNLLLNLYNLELFLPKVMKIHYWCI